MNLTEDEIIQKFSKNCGHCNRKILLLYEFEFTCFSCEYNVNKQKHQPSKIQRKKNDFINRLNYTEHKILCICVDV